MIHTSPNKIEPGFINNDSIFGSCLFFSSDAYVMTRAERYYVYEAEFENIVNASQLYDEEIISEIADRFNVDEETAESLLDATGEQQFFQSQCEMRILNKL